MSKIEFHEITLDDKSWMDARFQEDDRNACEYTFANNFVWRKVYHVEVAEKYGCANIRFEEEGVVMYSYPISRASTGVLSVIISIRFSAIAWPCPRSSAPRPQ